MSGEWLTPPKDIIIYYAGGTLKYDLPDFFPSFEWSTITIPLTHTTFGVSESTFNYAMAHVSGLHILGEYIWGPDSVGIDNVKVLSPPNPPLPSIIRGPVKNPANGHTYYILDTALWGESEAAAQALGGHLVTINDQAENDWVWNTFTNYGANPITLWIGYYRVTPGGSEWAWSSGETVGFTKWYPGEPNNSLGNENYAAFVPPNQNLSKQWFDMYADFNYGYIYGIVEGAKSSPVPLTGVLLLLGA